MATPQLAKKSKDGSRPGYGGWDILDWIVDKGTKYAPILKTGVAALSTYAAWKDQQKKNELQQGAYDDFMAQAEAAGHEARAAVDVNLTPMTVSGVPTTKADVTDFTAVAARGGLMSIPNKQRKRYYGGTNPDDIPTMDEEVLTPHDFKMEGVDVLGEQVFYDTGRGDRANATQIWNQMQDPDKAIFDFDFEIFFMDGGWSDQIKSEVEVGTETEMASAVDPQDALNDMSMEIFKGRQLHELTPEEHQMLIDMANDQAAAPGAEGIMQAAKGGRIGYATRGIVDENIVTDFDEAAPVQEDIRVTIKQIAEQSASPENFPATDSDFAALASLSDNPDAFPSTDYDFEVILKIAKETNFTTPEQSKEEIYAQYMARGGRPGYAAQGFVGSTPEEGSIGLEEKIIHPGTLDEGNIGMPGQPTTEFEHEGAIAEDESGLMQVAKIVAQLPIPLNPLHVWKTMKMAGVGIAEAIEIVKNKFGEEEITEETTMFAHGGRIKKAPGGIMDLGGLEKDYRTTGGFVPLGGRERAVAITLSSFYFVDSLLNVSWCHTFFVLLY